MRERISPPWWRLALFIAIVVAPVTIAIGVVVWTQVRGEEREVIQEEEEEAFPQVVIESPVSRETLPAGDITIEVQVTRFELVDRIGDSPALNEGHIIYYFNVDKVPTDPGEPALTEEGTYHATHETSHTWEGVEAGEHRFWVQLVNNDQTVLTPPRIASVDVTVE
jgi:hypothetical protein